MDTTNNIHELLKRAAQAASIELDLNTPNDGGYRAKQNGQWTRRWAPHLDDGDSRRLEVALSLTVACRLHEVEVFDEDGCLYSIPMEVNAPIDVRLTKTRMAVLHAAASLCPIQEA